MSFLLQGAEHLVAILSLVSVWKTDDRQFLVISQICTVYIFIITCSSFLNYTISMITMAKPKTGEQLVI